MEVSPPRLIDPAYPPLEDEELDVLDGYLRMCDAAESTTVSLGRVVVVRLMSSAAAHLIKRNWSERLSVDQAQWLHIREQINTLADESAKITLHRLLNAAIRPGDKPPVWAFDGEGNPSAQPITAEQLLSDETYLPIRGEDLIGTGILGAQLEHRLLEDRDKPRVTWTSGEVTSAALAAARAAIPPRMTAEPEHYPEDGTNPRPICICGKSWPHAL